MDYKYIEQLLERYWECETSLEEEQILKTFFRQQAIPSHLEAYRALFVYQCQAKEEVRLSDDFDQRILAEIERPVVKAKRLSLVSRFMPVFKAAAMLILIFTVGGVVKHSVGGVKQGIVYQNDQINRGSSEVPMAYELDTTKVILKKSEISEGIRNKN